MTLPETSARGNYKNLEQDNKIISWTKWIWVEIRGLLPNMKQLFQGHIHIMSTLPEIPGCFFVQQAQLLK